ncbi:hypothetical protein COU61_04810 [Candidatus Pacearchaeota archaeon CG10_big_fil_rev_8_21_14_0_10_35_13]|nr:MAG: hypothetical protein COU61_04810 [Candidatus Pacearchaeota archaeon CG10_big_fil_rev_8_21_14_0_10_35_13]
MKIRELIKEDRAEWIELVRKADNRDKEWADEKFSRYVGSKKMKKMFVMEDKGKLVGFMAIKGEDNEENVREELNDDFILVCWIALLPEYRGRGIGSKLLKHAVRYLKKWDKKGIFLGCSDNRTNFYVRNGYSHEGKFLNGWGDKENLMIMKVKG